MILSTQTDVLGRRHGDEAAIRILAEAGFDAFDMSLFRMFSDKTYWANLPDYKETAAHLKAVAEECGIVCNQAHAPFATTTGDPADDEERFQTIVRSLEIAAILGADSIIVHPIHHLPYVTHAKELREMNITLYKRLVPYCEKFGIHVACENMWQRNKEAGGRIINSVCSTAEEFNDYLDAVDSPWIVGCLDVGHVVLTDEDLPLYVHTMGNRRLRALHVHDNDLFADSHTLPYTLKIDFDGFCQALGEIDYQGDFTFEADNFLGKLPVEIEADAVKFLEKVGRHLMSKVEASRPSHRK